jgi:hypothetical protein
LINSIKNSATKAARIKRNPVIADVGAMEVVTSPAIRIIPAARLVHEISDQRTHKARGISKRPAIRNHRAIRRRHEILHPQNENFKCTDAQKSSHSAVIDCNADGILR